MPSIVTTAASTKTSIFVEKFNEKMIVCSTYLYKRVKVTYIPVENNVLKKELKPDLENSIDKLQTN